MCMDEDDLKSLKRMVKEYDVRDVLEALKLACDERAGELVDQELKDEAKPLTQVSWHLEIFSGR